MREFLALGYLRGEGEITPGQLRDRLGITTASVTALLDRLEHAGYMHREPHPRDRRSLLVKLDAPGRQEVEILFGSLASDVREALAGMSSDEQDAVEYFLKVVSGCFGRHIQDCSATN